MYSAGELFSNRLNLPFGPIIHLNGDSSLLYYKHEKEEESHEVFFFKLAYNHKEIFTIALLLIASRRRYPNFTQYNPFRKFPLTLGLLHEKRAGAINKNLTHQ